MKYDKKQSFTIFEVQKKLEYYCAYQDRCHIEVIRKLKNLGIISSAIDIIVTHLIERNFLNETRFAQSFARGKFRIKKWGKRRIINELKSRQISNYNIKLGLKEISETEYKKTFDDLFEKQMKEVANLPKIVQKRKIISYLAYRGWEKEKIYRALNEY